MGVKGREGYLYIDGIHYMLCILAQKVWQYTGTTHPLNPKYDDIELPVDTEYRVVGVVIEKRKRYR